MDRTASLVERTDHEPGVDEQPSRFPRKSIDPDAALVAQLRRADTGAVEAFVGVYGDRVYRLAIRITGNTSDAEEVVQDALWTASRKIDTFHGAAAFGSWVYRITANAAYQKLRGRRSQRHEVSWEDLVPSFDDTGQHAEVAVDWSRRLKDPAIEGELKGVLGRAIDELPADYRTAFLLHDVDGLSNPEIARTLQVKLAAIKSRVHRARLFLRRRLRGYVGASLDAARLSAPSISAGLRWATTPGSVAQNFCERKPLMHRTRAMSHRNVEAVTTALKREDCNTRKSGLASATAPYISPFIHTSR